MALPHHHALANPANTLAAIGAVIGAALVGIAAATGDGHGHEQHDNEFLGTFLTLALESAPALLLAYVLAGLLRGAVTQKNLRWLHKGSTSSQAIRGILFGLPLPICSCGVLPLYESLIKRGVPAAAALAFLVATPELGIDAIFLSLPLLGTELTLARLAAAFLVALLAALLVSRMIDTKAISESRDLHLPERSVRTKIIEGLRFGLVELFDHTMPWVLAGLLIAAWVEPLLGHELLQQVPSELQIPLFALIGIPLYVCASGSTPIAAIAIHKGVSPGAGLAFLIAGPATNMTTFGILSKLHGKRVAILFGTTIFVGAVVIGLAVDYMTLQVLSELHAHEHHESSWLQWSCLFCLSALFASSLFRQGPRGAMAQITQPMHHAH